MNYEFLAEADEESGLAVFAHRDGFEGVDVGTVDVVYKIGLKGNHNLLIAASSFADSACCSRNCAKTVRCEQTCTS